jgi:hypothetical protein
VVRHKYNIAAFAAVAAVRAAFRHIRLSSECHGAVAASSRPDGDDRSIDKHVCSLFLVYYRRKPANESCRMRTS